MRLSLPVQMLSRRDFLFPDADEKYAPEVLAYIHDIDDAQPLGFDEDAGRSGCDVPYLSDLKKVRLPGVVRPVDRAACGGVAEQFAAAHHGMDGATKVQWSRRGRITPALLDALP